MSETVISWNIENLVTIALMGLIGFALIRVIVTAVSNFRGAAE